MLLKHFHLFSYNPKFAKNNVILPLVRQKTEPFHFSTDERQLPVVFKDKANIKIQRNGK